MRFILAAAALSLATPALAQSLDVPSGTYNIDPSHASVVWKLSHLGFSSYTGMFDREGIAATVELDADDVANSTLSVTINGQGIETLHPGPDDFDSEIESEKVLNTERFPEITFATTEIEVTGDNTANISGQLTMNNQTHPLVLEATLNRAADHPMSGTPTFGVSAEGTLDRTEWGVNFLAGPIGTDVSFAIEAEFQLAE